MVSALLISPSPTITSLVPSTSTSASWYSTTSYDDDGSPGSAQSSYGQSLSTFISSLAASLIAFGAELGLFLILRKRIKRVYEPKTYAVPTRQQIAPAGSGLLDWIFPTLLTPDSEFIKKAGLDAYFYMRYLVMLIFIFFTASLVVLPILLPVNSVDTFSGTASGLDRMAWVNIGADTTQRYWAHLLLAVIYIIFLCAVFQHELNAYVKIRQRYLISPQHRLRASATTVLIRAIPSHLLDSEKLKHVFGVLPGGVRNVWINRDFDKLTERIDDRNYAAALLESAETKLIQIAHIRHQKSLRQRNASNSASSDEEPLLNEDQVWKKYVSWHDRPTHRLRLSRWFVGIPFISRKVDTIDWARTELNRLNKEIEDMQENETRFPLLNSAFIQFNSQVAAHMACQSLASESPKHMAPRLVEINPKDVLWANMSIKWWEEVLRKLFTLGAVITLIVGWAFPVAFVGVISQLSYLTNALPFLSFINDLPSAIKGIISGILPPAALAGLMSLLPYIFRFFAIIRGVSTGVQSEITVQTSYFWFLFVQVFLVITVASSITTVIQQLTQNPTSIPALLATNLPKASNFFFSYLILQGLTLSAAALLRIGPLFNMTVLGPLLDNTAREKFTRITTLRRRRWGTFYPKYTNLAAIGIVYTIVSPLIIPMCLITFTLFYIAYRYEFLYCQYNEIDSGGLYFHRAINQLFVGVYVMELCLVGLFFLVRDNNLQPTCTTHGIIMILVLIGTVMFQYVINKSYRPLFQYLPIELENRARVSDRLWEQEESEPLLDGPSSSNYDAVSGHNSDTGNEYAESSTPRSKVSSVAEWEDSTLNLQSPLAEVFSAFKRQTVNSAPGNLVGHVVGKSVGHTVGKLGNQLERIPFKHLIYTNHEELRAEIAKNAKDLVLLEGVPEDLEDISKEERDHLVNRAFKNESLRAQKPTIWIPHDDLGLADDEIRITRERYPNIQITSEGASLNSRGKVIFVGRPPDFDEKSKIAL
ncbi:hypothetical protein V1514DRAFT_366518 [Lipomyces japonicus]|uniref:uncharacterized protein n=1 Tax=Lipomyces japonicus TaxID=56871 RepID=UPI0034CEEF99